MCMKKKRNISRKLGRIERDILKELTLGDMLYAYLLSAKSTGRFYKLAQQRATERYRRKKAMERLKEDQYIALAGEHLSITRKGRNAIGELAANTRSLLKNTTWDRKWRVAAYDIPEKYASLRDKVRDILKRAGFRKLQQSIWIFPHHCEDLVQLIKTEGKLGPYILYGVLERIEDEDRLMKLFGVK